MLRATFVIDQYTTVTVNVQSRQIEIEGYRLSVEDFVSLSMAVQSIVGPPSTSMDVLAQAVVEKLKRESDDENWKGGAD